jgi:hypothetical protein
MTAPGVPEFREFVYEGHRLRLNEDPAVRANDIVRCRVSVLHQPDGKPAVIDPPDHALPPLPGIPPPGEVYNPRLFIERVLRLGFDDVWIATITRWMNQLRLWDGLAEDPR